MAGDERVRLRLSAARSRELAGLAALNRGTPGLQRCRLDLGLGREIRVGDLSLWTVGPVAPRGLGLGSWKAMGAGLGLLAHEQGLRRLGAVAAGSAVRPPQRHP